MPQDGLDLEVISFKNSDAVKPFSLEEAYRENTQIQLIFFSEESKQKMLTILQMAMARKCYRLTFFFFFTS